MQKNKNMGDYSEDVLHEKGKFSRVQAYLAEFVYGGIDGSVTTFAVVAGSAGAQFDPAIIIVLGLANLFADGFSMSVGSYLSAQSEADNYLKHQNIEYWEVENIPEKERQEIRDIYAKKGFTGELLEKAVNTICADKDRWVDVMMKEELEMQMPDRSPIMKGLVTFLSFLVVGFIPLLTYVGSYFFGWKLQNVFGLSVVLTSLSFVTIGFLKSSVTHTSHWKGVLETLLLGGLAAGIAYGVGAFLASLV